MTREIRTVRVDLANRSYDILIGEGLLARAGELIRPLMGAGRSKVFVIADETVAGIHGVTLEQRPFRRRHHAACGDDPARRRLEVLLNARNRARRADLAGAPNATI